MRFVVPHDGQEPKTRLASVLDARERSAFARAMLADVVDAVGEAGHEPQVLATAPVEVPAPVRVDDRPLSTAVNDALARVGRPVGVVMSDLALVEPQSISRLASASGDLVVAAGRGGGTNALVVRDAGFRVDYHGASYLDHLRIARTSGLSVREVDSMRLATDVDEPTDLTEVLVHADGRATRWLRDAGFELSVDENGRAGATR